MPPKPRVRTESRKKKGTEPCPHTCTSTPCRSGRDGKGPPEWNREGGSASRHKKKASKHPNCHEGCPEYANLEKPKALSRQLSDTTTPQRPTPPVQQKDRIYSILAVLESRKALPDRPKKGEEPPTWLEASLSAQSGSRLLDEPALKGYIFQQYLNAFPQDYVSVLIYEKLLMFQRWEKRDARVKVKYMSWSQFKDLVESHDRDPESSGHLNRYDMIWGGANLCTSLDRREFQSLGEISHYLSQIRLLAKKTLLWPPPEEMLFASQEVAVLGLLDMIAVEVTRTARPRSWPVVVPLDTLPENTVLKREGATEGTHVFLPKYFRKESLTDLNKELVALSSPGFQWFAQEHVGTLVSFGERRSIIIGGNLYATFCTVPARKGEWKVWAMPNIYSLAELTDLVKEQPNILSSEHALDREGGTWKEIQAAKQEHAAFAMSTYCALVHHDVEAFGFSSLSTICRLDIGIMMNPATQMFDYFVNGVERGCAMSWSSGSFFPGDTLHAQAIADELLPHMLELIDNHSE